MAFSSRRQGKSVRDSFCVVARGASLYLDTGTTSSIAKQNTYSVLIAFTPVHSLLLRSPPPLCSAPAAAHAAASPLQIMGIFISSEMSDLSFCVNLLRS
jgi:hypothetical protein